MQGSLYPSTRARVVTAAFMTQALVLGAVFSYGVFFSALEDELGWSRTLLSTCSSVAFLVMGILAIAAGRLNDRFGPRWVLSASGAICGLGLALMSLMQSSWQLVLFFGLFVGIGLSTHDVVTLSTVTQWFERRRGVMTAVVKMGTACGQMSVPLLATALYLWLGWRQALLVMGIATGLGLVLVAQFMQRPEAVTAAKGKVAGAGGGLSYAAARRSKTLWLMCAIQFCFFPALMTVPLHMVAYARDLGMSLENATSVLSAVAAASLVGRLFVGLLFDRIGGRLTLRTCLLMLSAGLLSLLLLDSAQWLYLCAFVYGCAHGGLFTVVSPTVAEYFGLQAHGSIFGTVVFFGTLGGAVGPILAGMIYDSSGSYQLAFQILISLSVCAVLLTLLLSRERERV